MNWIKKLVKNPIALALAIVAVTSMSAYAQSTACTSLTTTAPGATTPGASIQDAILCMVELVSPRAVLVSIVTVFVPLFILIWGARGGFALVATIVKRMFGFLTSRA